MTAPTATLALRVAEVRELNPLIRMLRLRAEDGRPLPGFAAGAHIRKGDLLATVDDPDLVVTLSGRFMQYYRENAKWLERTYAFVPRVGADFLREVIVEDSLGIAADLDARMQTSIDSYKDPWKEGAVPAAWGGATEPGVTHCGLHVTDGKDPGMPVAPAADICG